MILAVSEVGFEIEQPTRLAVMEFDLVVYDDDVRPTFVMITNLVRYDVGAMISAYFVDASNQDQTLQYWPVLSSTVVLNSSDKQFEDVIKILEKETNKMALNLFENFSTNANLDENKIENSHLVMQKVMGVTAKNPLANRHCSPYDEAIAKNATILDVNFPISPDVSIWPDGFETKPLIN